MVQQMSGIAGEAVISLTAGNQTVVRGIALPAVAASSPHGFPLSAIFNSPWFGENTAALPGNAIAAAALLSCSSAHCVGSLPPPLQQPFAPPPHLPLELDPGISLASN